MFAHFQFSLYTLHNIRQWIPTDKLGGAVLKKGLNQPILRKNFWILNENSTNIFPNCQKIIKIYLTYLTLKKIYFFITQFYD